MSEAVESARSRPVGDAAVRAKTGKSWSEWFHLLDSAGGPALTHKQLVRHLSRQEGVSDWWQQMITVRYEQERGLRELHQTSDGFQASVSRTLTVPVSELYAAWVDGSVRELWLPKPITVRRATECRSMRITWPDGTNVDVNFVAKGDGRSQVSLQHSKLADREATARLKVYWAEALDRLKAVLGAQ